MRFALECSRCGHEWDLHCNFDDLMDQSHACQLCNCPEFDEDFDEAS